MDKINEPNQNKGKINSKKIWLIVSIIAVLAIAISVFLFVILNQGKIQPISKEDSFKNKVSQYKKELMDWYISKYIEKNGIFDYTLVNADVLTANYGPGGILDNVKNISDMIPSMKTTDAKKFVIESGQLKYDIKADGANSEENELAKSVLNSKQDSNVQLETAIDITVTNNSLTGSITLSDNNINITKSKYIITPSSIPYEANSNVWQSQQATNFIDKVKKVSTEELMIGNYYIQMLLCDSRNNLQVKVSNVFPVTTLKVLQLSTSSKHTLALLNNGTIKAWGYNYSGELGNGTNVDSTNPVNVKDITNAKVVYAGQDFSAAILNDGSVMAWGANNLGQLGNGTTTNSSIPVKVNSLSNVKSLQVFQSATIALLNDGTVYSWGKQIQNGRSSNLIVPTKVSSLANITQISSQTEHTLFLVNNGTVKSFGSNNMGMLGNGLTTSILNTTVDVNNISGNVKEVIAGNTNSFAILNNGSVKAWGQNDNGQLGNGTTSASGQTSPILLNNLENVKQIGVGDGFTVFLKENGNIETCGAGYYGQLADSKNVDNPLRKEVSNIKDVSQIATSYNGSHVLALLNDGKVYAWGRNTEGQVGIGSKSNSVNVPTLITSLTSAKKIYTSQSSSYAILNDGTLKVWGDNQYGKLGTGTVESVVTPTTIALF